MLQDDEDGNGLHYVAVEFPPPSLGSKRPQEAAETQLCNVAKLENQTKHSEK